MPKVRHKDGTEVEVSQKFYDELEAHAASYDPAMTVDGWFQIIVEMTRKAIPTGAQFVEVTQGKRKPPSDDDPGGMIN